MSIAVPVRPFDLASLTDVDDDGTYYPSSDGKPLAETDVHIAQIINLRVTLQNHFRDDPLCYVASNLLWYYVQGDIKKRVSPDVMVVRGVPKHPPRMSYWLWREQRVPDAVIEISSRSTRHIDTGRKYALYRELGVREYFLFDPQGRYLKPALQGHRLEEGIYVPLQPNEAGRLVSQRLGLELGQVDEVLRLFDPVAGHWLLTPDEEHDALQAAETTIQQEAEARLNAERLAWREESARRQETLARSAAEAAVQRETLARIAAEASVQRETQSRLDAEAAVQRETAARLAAETELARLRAELARRDSTRQ